MELLLNKKTVVVFDLDDTLYKEVDYLKSAYREIASNTAKPEQTFVQMLNRYEKKEDVFAYLLAENNRFTSKQELLEIYRNHLPTIRLSASTAFFLQQLKDYNIPLCIITDGRSVTQRNKIKALKLVGWMAKIVISEELGSQKPDKRNYKAIADLYEEHHLIYIGDNTAKDFVTPNEMGWTTIGLKNNGQNIHPQEFDISSEYLPQFWIDSFDKIVLSYTE
nr:HAD family hydrolase [uncultured Carboxylicivirga sp.]